MKPDKAKIKRQAMKPVRETLRCSTESCTGEMVFTGEAFTTFETAYGHRCNGCGVHVWLDNGHFPRIVYVPAKSRKP